jgi:Transport and Golgi organisation 2
MCTVTVVPRASGFRLMCNRDERRTRPPAIPPWIHQLGGRLAVFPVDPQGGGTWVGVNDAGVAVALLNVHTTPQLRAEPPTRSRGLIVLDVLRCGSMPAVLAAIANLDVRRFGTFRLVLVHGSTVAVATSDGARSMTGAQVPLDRPLLFTSSSLGDALVQAPRRRLFQRMVVQGRAGWLDGQARFHRHQWPSRPEISVRMRRKDAMTVSRTVVDITSAGRVVLYDAPGSEPSSREERTWSFLY